MKKTISLVLSLSIAGLAQAGTIAVGPDVGYDFETIQAGIDAANDGDTVLVAPGEYVIAEPITFRGKAITVQSEAGSDQTTIRMGTPADPNRASVLVFENKETDASVLDGFTINGGTGCWLWFLELSEFKRFGGGICFFNASCGTVRNCSIVQNGTSDAGGGVGVGFGSAATLTNCIISENSAIDGGGIFCWENASVTITDCTIRDNSATGVIQYVEGYGGGLFCGVSSMLTMVNCKIAENSSGVGGAGLLCWNNSSLTMSNSEIVDNTATGWGGGLHCDKASAILTNCIIARNSGLGRDGGGVLCPFPNSSVTFNNCTIWGNLAQRNGGAIRCWQGTVTVTNSIIRANIAPQGHEISVGGGGTLSLSYSNVADGQAGVHVRGGSTVNWGAANIDTDPFFADPTNDDYHLTSEAGRWDPNSQTWIQDDITSPCIDAGDPMSPIRWESFPNGGFVNMGAYGGTTEASKTYFGEPICETIVAGDINGDGQVNRADLEIMALHWTDNEPLPLP